MGRTPFYLGRTGESWFHPNSCDAPITKHFVQLNGSKILGHHPDTYDSSWLYNTGRGAWIPTTSNEGMWFGIAQWFGIQSNNELDYVLPNMKNFGCRLYSEADLYKGSTGKLQ
jgi:hypothetical protein